MRKYIHLLPSLIRTTVVICGAFILVVAILSMFNHTFTANTIDTLAGIWTGLATAFIIRLDFTSNLYLSFMRTQRFKKQFSLKLIVFGMTIFLIAGVLGSGHVFGIDFTGRCPSGSTEAWLTEGIQGKIHVIVFWGAIFGMSLDLFASPVLVDTIYDGLWIWKVLVITHCFISIFFSYQFSRVFGSPYILASVISGIGSGIWIMRMKRKAASDPQTQLIVSANNPRLRFAQIFLQYLSLRIDLKHFMIHIFAVGLFLVPVAAYLSNLMMVCSS